MSAYGGPERNKGVSGKKRELKKSLEVSEILHMGVETGNSSRYAASDSLSVSGNFRFSDYFDF